MVGIVFVVIVIRNMVTAVVGKLPALHTWQGPGGTADCTCEVTCIFALTPKLGVNQPSNQFIDQLINPSASERALCGHLTL